jgi:ABC-type transporter Mla subunit MlaD
MRTSFASLRATEEVLDPALRAMQPAARELEGGLAGLQSFSERATPALTDLRPAVSALQPMVSSLRPTSSRLRAAMISLDPQIPRVDQFTVEANRCLDDIGRFFQDTLSVTKFGNPTGPFPRGSLIPPDVPGTTNPPLLTRKEKCYEGGPG